MVEILGMSIALAAVVAAIAGIAARNIEGWLKSDGTFNIRHAAASGGIAVIVGIPIIVSAFSAITENVEALSEEAQLSVFLLQVIAIAGFDALAKGAAKAVGAKKK